MRNMFITLLVLALVHGLAAQSPSRLDDPVHGDFRIDNPRFLNSCRVGTAVDQIARSAGVLVGFENTPDCPASPRSRSRTAQTGDEVLTGLTARAALDRLIELAPAYRWKEMDGVAVVRPIAAWDDPANVLNRPVAAFTVANAHPHEALHVLLQSALPSLFAPHTDERLSGNGRRDGSTAPAEIDAPVSVAFRGGTLLAALNALANAHQRAMWQFGYISGSALIELQALDNLGSATLIHTAPIVAASTR